MFHCRLVFVCFFLHAGNVGMVYWFMRKKYKPKKVVVDVVEKGPDNVILY